MVFRVSLYLGRKRIGSVTFRTLLVTDNSQYVCEPPGLLSFEQIVRLSEQMRRLPAVPGGVIGEYEWVEESTDS